MTKSTHTFCGLILAACLAVAGGCASAPPPTPVDIEPDAQRAIDRMRASMGQIEHYHMTIASVTDEALPSGKLVQVSRTTEMNVARPDRLSISVARDSGERWSAWLDDGKFVVLDETSKRWAQTTLHAPLDAALAQLEDQYGLYLPLSDVVSGLRRDDLLYAVQAGLYVGTEPVGGYECDHVLFRQPVADWQAWIDVGDPAILRRIVMTYKDEPDSPGYEATVTKWDTETQPTADDWQPQIPEDAQEVPFLELLEKE